MIQLSEALERMQDRDEVGKLKAFSIQFVKADRARKTGGQIVEIDKAFLLPENKKRESNKKANHWKNSTRNIVLPNGQKRKLHIRLITNFNSQLVIY